DTATIAPFGAEFSGFVMTPPSLARDRDASRRVRCRPGTAFRGPCLGDVEVPARFTPGSGDSGCGRGDHTTGGPSPAGDGPPVRGVDRRDDVRDVARRSLRERRRVDDEAVADVRGEDPLVGLVHLVGADELGL